MDLFGTKKRQAVQEAADLLEKSCVWLMPALLESSFDDFIATVRKHHGQDSYVDQREQEFGFFLEDGPQGEKLVSFHAKFNFTGDGTRCLNIETHQDFFGLVVTGLKDQPLNVSVNDANPSKGRYCAELKAELLKRPGFYSLNDFMLSLGL
jgi:hypothetical protein